MSEIEERNKIHDNEGVIKCEVCAKKYFSSVALKIHLKIKHGSIQQLEKMQQTLFPEDVVFLIKEEKQCQIWESLHHGEFVKLNNMKTESEENIFPKNVLRNNNINNNNNNNHLFS